MESNYYYLFLNENIDFMSLVEFESNLKKLNKKKISFKLMETKTKIFQSMKLVFFIQITFISLKDKIMKY